VLEELGMTGVINATGSLTVLGGSVLDDEGACRPEGRIHEIEPAGCSAVQISPSNRTMKRTAEMGNQDFSLQLHLLVDQANLSS
jgi:hypothetical protein